MMDIKKVLLIAGAVIAAAVVALIVFISNGQSSEENEGDPTAAPSSSSSFAPIPVETSAPVEVPTAEPVPTTATPTPTQTIVSEDKVPVVLDPLKPIQIDGFGSSEVLEAKITPEEIAARDNIQAVIPVMANLSSPKYTSPLDARDELVAKGLITENMARTGFMPNFTSFQQILHDAGYTVQTTGLRCIMRTLSPQTELERGKVTCYFTRQYVDALGNTVGNATFVQTTGGAGSIDPSQIARVEVSIKQESGSWKVDGIRFN